MQRAPQRPRLVGRFLLVFACAGLLADAVAGQAPALEEVVSAVDTHLEENGAQLLRDFRSLLEIPNVSRPGAENVANLNRNAAWIVDHLAARGFESEVVRGASGFPYVIGSREGPVGAPTVVIYAHFDGQPVAPENWASPPFVPTLKDGDGAVLDWGDSLGGALDPDWRVYARSAGDDKAPVLALAATIDALVASDLGPQVHVKVLLDGEEESGSPSVAEILDRYGDRLEADLLLFCDGPMHQSALRQLVFGVRGSMTMHLTTYGPKRPLHSGHYGNWAPHPTDALMRLLVTLKDETGAIQVPGYLDSVRPITAAERAAVAAMPRIDTSLQHELALGRVEGDGRRLEELVMEPAIIVKGFSAGGVGSQSRNIILPSAQASLNLRLVPDQTPEVVVAALVRHFEQQGFHVVEDDPSEDVLRAHPNVLKVDAGGGYPAFRTQLDLPIAQRLERLLEELDGREPLLTPTMGGSLPIYLFEQALDMPIIILPIANHDNNQHGRDENLRLGNLFDAVRVYAAVLTQLSADDF